MERTPHPDFLGGGTETGQAFDKTMKPQRRCYICQGAIGYRVPAEFLRGDVKTYPCQPDWRLRDGYAHSCAEVEVSPQCSKN
jgi:hypothetical protein